MKTLNLDANYFLDHSTRAIKGKPRMANPEGNSSKEEDDDESIIWNSRWNKNYSGIWQSRGDKPDPQTMLRPKCISLSFRHQYAEPVLAGLHKESNLAGQSFPGSKEAPVRATGAQDSRRILSYITVCSYDTTHLQENPQRLGWGSWRDVLHYILVLHSGSLRSELN